MASAPQGDAWRHITTRASLAADLFFTPYSPITVVAKVTAPILFVVGAPPPPVSLLRLAPLRMGSDPVQPAVAATHTRCTCISRAGKRDELCPYKAAVAATALARNATLISYDCLHFDIYGPPWRQKAIAEQVAFLQRFGA